MILQNILLMAFSNHLNDSLQSYKKWMQHGEWRWNKGSTSVGRMLFGYEKYDMDQKTTLQIMTYVNSNTK